MVQDLVVVQIVLLESLKNKVQYQLDDVPKAAMRLIWDSLPKSGGMMESWLQVLSEGQVEQVGWKTVLSYLGSLREILDCGSEAEHRLLLESFIQSI